MSLKSNIQSNSRIMLLRRTIPAALSYSTTRHHSSAAKNLKSLSKIPHKYRAKAIQEAQEALTDYLHTVRTIPYTFAENISKYSLVSLSAVISKVKFSSSLFSKSVRRFFRYHPLNEFELFFESIGINVNEFDRVLPARKFFLSEDLSAFNASCALYNLGVPWNKLGMMYEKDRTIFDRDPRELRETWRRYLDLGFTSSSLIGICLVFPHVLNVESEMETFIHDLNRVIIDFDLINDVEDSVDSWIDVCRKIQLFNNLGCSEIDIFEMIGRNKHILVEHSEEIIAKNIEYFHRFGVTNEEVASIVLSGSRIFEFDTKNSKFCVAGLLQHFGMDEHCLNSFIEKHPYVFGRNKLANLPHVMRALNLHQWFFDKIKDGDPKLLLDYSISNPNEDFNKEFAECLTRIQSSRVPNHTLSKLEFLQSIGFGENGLTVKVLKHVHGTSSLLHERFNCLIRNGIEFSNLCKIISLSPKILNQQSEILEKKVAFLCHDIGSSLRYLDVFPAYLCFDLEKRIKPRYRFHVWLMDTGLCEREYSLASIIATSEISFIARVYRIHPAAPKRYLEIFMNQDCDSPYETS